MRGFDVAILCHPEKKTNFSWKLVKKNPSHALQCALHSGDQINKLALESTCWRQTVCWRWVFIVSATVYEVYDPKSPREEEGKQWLRDLPGNSLGSDLDWSITEMVWWSLVAAREDTTSKKQSDKGD